VVVTTVARAAAHVLAANAEASARPAIDALLLHSNNELAARIRAVAAVAHPAGRAVVVVPAALSGSEGGEGRKKRDVKDQVLHCCGWVIRRRLSLRQRGSIVRLDEWYTWSGILSSIYSFMPNAEPPTHPPFAL
jgi:hypothetical protein